MVDQGKYRGHLSDIYSVPAQGYTGLGLPVSGPGDIYQKNYQTYLNSPLSKKISFSEWVEIMDSSMVPQPPPMNPASFNFDYSMLDANEKQWVDAAVSKLRISPQEALDLYEYGSEFTSRGQPNGWYADQLKGVPEASIENKMQQYKNILNELTNTGSSYASQVPTPPEFIDNLKGQSPKPRNFSELASQMGGTDSWSDYAKWVLKQEQAGSNAGLGPMGMGPVAKFEDYLNQTNGGSAPKPKPDMTMPKGPKSGFSEVPPISQQGAEDALQNLKFKNFNPSSYPEWNWYDEAGRFADDAGFGAAEGALRGFRGLSGSRAGRIGRGIGGGIKGAGWGIVGGILLDMLLNSTPTTGIDDINNAGGSWYYDRENPGNIQGSYWKPGMEGKERTYGWDSSQGQYPTFGTNPGLYDSTTPYSPTWDNTSGYLSVENNRPYGMASMTNDGGQPSRTLTSTGTGREGQTPMVPLPPKADGQILYKATETPVPLPTPYPIPTATPTPDSGSAMSNAVATRNAEPPPSDSNTFLPTVVAAGQEDSGFMPGTATPIPTPQGVPTFPSKQSYNPYDPYGYGSFGSGYTYY